MDMFLSDFDSYSESSSCSDQEDDEFLYSGKANSILENLQETIGKIDDFLLFERRYFHGDIVCNAKNPLSQMGKVTNVEIIVDLETVDSTKLKNINSNELQRIRSVSMGDFVISGPWVGKVEQITDSVSVIFDDGSKSEFTVTGNENENGKLVALSLSPDLFDDSQYSFYPGQRVKAVDPVKSKSTQWFCGSKNETQNEGTVCSVDAGGVYVNWVGCVLFDSDSIKNIPSPPSLQNPKNLTCIACFPHSNWQIGDMCVLNKHSGNVGFKEVFVISKMKMKVDVLWQDGSESCGLDSSCLDPVNTIDAHDFWPHQFVLEKGISDDDRNVKKWGVVNGVDAEEKTVNVKWELELKLESGGNMVEETVSAYELIEHPDYSYSMGDLVFRMHKRKNFKNVDDSETCCGDVYLDYIGIVINFKNGFVEVNWANGFTSKVAPHEIFRVEKSEGVSATPLLHNDNTDPNHEKSEPDIHTPDPQEKDSSDSEEDEEKDCLKTLYNSTTFNVSRTAIGFLSNVASRLFGFRSYTSLSENESESGLESEEENQVLVDRSSKKNLNEKNEMINDVSGKNPTGIKQFEMVNDCSNHHFVGKSSISSQVKKSWLKKVNQEWNILSNNLPETIYVRVFEERMDLIKAVIIGAPETPYQDCLFFFDIYLPPEYPNEPPMVHYESGGLRVNPNLYESGRVCLSLLNTWTGSGSETWNPNASTILQVLLSLQALVLNKKPYFNEAGYDQQVGSLEGEKNSCSYNENAFLMSCKSMLYILRKPPKHFEALVEEHFGKCCRNILMACKAYLEGVSIGCVFASQVVEGEGQKGNSTGFKIMLSKLVPKLVEAFMEKGFDCGEYGNTEWW